MERLAAVVLTFATVLAMAAEPDPPPERPKPALPKRGPSGFGRGWPGGKVRFVRIKYAGGDWDQDMEAGAGRNMLKEFYKRTKIPCWDWPESIEISLLTKFPRNQTPPFVYITGKRGIDVSKKELEVLREYLLERSGMLFADNGGGYFHHAFDRLVRRLFPRGPWIDIPDDDEIYCCYYELPYGAPPLWHHSGTRALGIKHKGRWVVFYHQGDLGDAWRNGHAGTSDENAELAYQLGINIIHYSYVKCMEFVRAPGKPPERKKPPAKRVNDLPPDLREDLKDGRLEK